MVSLKFIRENETSIDTTEQIEYSLIKTNFLGYK